MHLKNWLLLERKCKPLLKRQTGHAIHTALAAGDQGDMDALARQIESLLAAFSLAGQLSFKTLLIDAPQWFQEIQVQAVAHPDLTTGKGAMGCGGELI